MNKLNVTIAGIEFKNPIIAASGCYGFGTDYESLYAVEKLGGISLKGMTLNPRKGNPPPRIAESYSGMLNSVGLQNPGCEAFLKDYLPKIADKDVVKIANIAGATAEECAELASKLSGSTIDMLELNISCPNVKKGGAAFGTSVIAAAEVTKMVRLNCKKPLIVKLSPNVTDITEIAKAAESEGADAVSLINTLLAMRIDIKTRRPILRNNVGGLSGSAVFPLAVRMVWQVSNSVKIPVIGLGGITDWKDAVEMMMAGASAVQMGSAIIADPLSPLRVIDGLEEYCRNNNLANISEIVGQVLPW